MLKSVGSRSRSSASTRRAAGSPTSRSSSIPTNPLEFTGDLKFVEELRKAIPPDLFGKGPSLDISPTGIRAGFSFALPPVAVGVFALKDVSLGAAPHAAVPRRPADARLQRLGAAASRSCCRSASSAAAASSTCSSTRPASRSSRPRSSSASTASIDLGVASGGVHIMAGIYFKLERQEPGTDLAPTLSGYLRMGG